MPGRIPKHKDEKINRSTPPVPPQTLPVVHDLPVPPLSANYRWSAIGRAYWKRIWESPMAVTYIDADIPGLERMTMLTEITHASEVTQGILSELRQLEDRFGLSPLARRRLQWDIDKELERRSQDQVGGATPEDDERFLRVVS